MKNNITCIFFTILILILIVLCIYNTYSNNAFINTLTKSTREGLIRGGLTGYFSGGIPMAINNAATWGVLNGILSSVKNI